MKKILLTIFSALVIAESFAQVDAHFSQYYAHPLWLNPAMTGAFNGQLRISGIYRSQWGSITNPFVTSGLSVDVATTKNLNIGASLLNQTAGDAGYHYMNGSISIAYSGVKFGADLSQQVLIGLQGGLLSRRFDPAKFQFGDQWNPVTGFDPTTPSADILTKTGASSFDAGAGIAWLDAGENKNVNPFLGFAVSHLTHPADPFLAGSHSTLPMRYAVHGGAKVRVSDNTTVTPNLLYLRQGNAEEKMIGAAASISVNEDADLLFGLNYRFEDAVAPFAGMRFQNFTLGLSYDSNISNLGKMAGNTNAFEISLTYITPKSEYKGIPCPRF